VTEGHGRWLRQAGALIFVLVVWIFFYFETTSIGIAGRPAGESQISTKRTLPEIRRERIIPILDSPDKPETAISVSDLPVFFGGQDATIGDGGGKCDPTSQRVCWTHGEARSIGCIIGRPLRQSFAEREYERTVIDKSNICYGAPDINSINSHHKRHSAFDGFIDERCSVSGCEPQMFNSQLGPMRGEKLVAGESERLSSQLGFSASGKPKGSVKAAITIVASAPIAPLWASTKAALQRT